MICDLYNPETDLVEQLCLGLSDNLVDLFDKRTKRWRYPMMHCEGFTIGLFDDLAKNISAERAFVLIPKAMNVVIYQNDLDLFITALFLLNTLTVASYTTEISPILQIKLVQLKEKVVNMKSQNQASKILEEIYRWYRLV